MLHPNIQVKYSSIEGKGLFAKKKIPRGTVVWKIGEKDREYEPSQVKKFSKRYRKILDRYAYLSAEGKITYLTDDSKYFNHSCDPNVVPLFDEGVQMDVAITDIQAGGELLYDYGFLCDVDESMPCNCGLLECRRVIKRFPKRSSILKELEREAAKAGKAGLNIKQPLVGRRDPCICGSGEEYGKCHGK
jgi:SET domain-containing protein